MRDTNRNASSGDLATGFAPISAADATLLILGSLPGRVSLAQQAYYAHPRNAFWRIMRDLYGINGEYGERCLGLTENHIALWDVLQRSERPGSLDASIRGSTAVANDFARFFAKHPKIRRIAFNGKAAAAMFARHCQAPEQIALLSLPSTSPAYAAISYDEKLARWRQALLP